VTADTEHRSPIATLLRDVNLAGVTYSDLAEDAWRAGQVEAAFKWRHVAEGVRIARDRIVAANLPPAHPWVAVMVDVMVDTGRRAPAKEVFVEFPDRNVVPALNSAKAYAQVQKHPNARSVQYNDHRAFAYAPRSRMERGWQPNAYERPGMSWDSYGLRWDGGN
jgi:hypothetical protein